jgi:hypothetical protein
MQFLGDMVLETIRQLKYSYVNYEISDVDFGLSRAGIYYS